MSDLPSDIDNLADRLADTLQSVDVSSIQQRDEADNATEGANLATERAIQETLLHERGTDFPGRGLRVPAPRIGELDGRYGTDVELSDDDRDYAMIDRRLDAFWEDGLRVLRLGLTVDHLEPAVPLHGNSQEAEDAVGGESVVEDEPDREALIWEDEDQENNDDAEEYYDWRSDPLACIACREKKPLEDIWEAPCQHRYCGVCLEVMVQYWYKSSRAPECCRTVLPWEEYKSKINPELVAALDAKREELDSTDRFYCSEQTCSAFISEQDISADTATATCSVCKKQTCTKCKVAYHLGDCVPDASVSDVLKQAEEEGWKKCPRCQIFVERVWGCPHMTCYCGYEFCWDCGGPYPTCGCFDDLLPPVDDDVEEENDGFDEAGQAQPVDDGFEVYDEATWDRAAWNRAAWETAAWNIPAEVITPEAW